jgi:dienelactone hydrolase
MERAVSFRSAETLRGVLSVPEGAREAVIFVHGWSGYRCGPHRMFVNTARRLAAEGVVSLRFDLRGRGDSEGEADATDLDGMVDDLLAAATFVRAETGIERIYPLGICSGGNVVLGAASLGKSFAGLILWSTPLFAPQKVRGDRARRSAFFLVEYAKKAFRRQTWAKLFRGAIDFRGVFRTVKGRSAPEGRNPKDSRRDIMADLVGYRGPALFVYGSRDDEAIGAPEAYARFCDRHGIPAAFHTVDGANHSYYSVAWENEVIETTVGWLKSRGGSSESG